MMLLDRPGFSKMRACSFSPVCIMPNPAPFVKFSSDTLARCGYLRGHHTDSAQPHHWLGREATLHDLQYKVTKRHRPRLWAP